MKADVPVRDAATVMLVRDGRDGVEVFLMRRHLGAAFTPGAHVFPGGAVDAADHELDGVDPFVVAAIRECFEEAGALLAYDATDSFVDLRDPVTAARFETHRRAIHAGTLTMAELCAWERLRLATDALVPFGRRVTPPGAPRRYDTCFFVARAPAHQALVHDDAELIESGWFLPADALARFETGELDLIRPTQESLEHLAGLQSVDEILASVV